MIRGWMKRNTESEGGATCKGFEATLPTANIAEKDLHRAIAKLLDWKKIVYIHSRTDQRTTQAKGVPDFLFAVEVRHFERVPNFTITPVAWEAKTAKGKLRPEQIEMHNRMQTFPNYWHVKVIRSIDEAIADLETLGL